MAVISDNLPWSLPILSVLISSQQWMVGKYIRICSKFQANHYKNICIKLIIQASPTSVSWVICRICTSNRKAQSGHWLALKTQLIKNVITILIQASFLIWTYTVQSLVSTHVHWYLASSLVHNKKRTDIFVLRKWLRMFHPLGNPSKLLLSNITQM
jgi:hypothetical protein